MAVNVLNAVQPRMQLHYQTINATIDNTGNVVLGANFNSRLIVNVKSSLNLTCWYIGVGTANDTKMIHFTDYMGATHASGQITIELYWLEESDFVLVDETT